MKEDILKKKDLEIHVPGSAEYVVAHARYRRSRKHRPSMSFMGEMNPIKALMKDTIILKPCRVAWVSKRGYSGHGEFTTESLA